MKDPQHVRHLLGVKVTGSFLLNFVKTIGPHVISCEGIPADSKIYRMSYDAERDTLFAIYEHPSFPLVECGEPVKLWAPQYHTYSGEAAIEAIKNSIPTELPIAW